MNNQNIQFSCITLNTWALPFLSNNIGNRLNTVAKELELIKPDAIQLQEIHTHGALNLLKNNLPSFPYINYTHGLCGPKGALVTFSRYPIISRKYISLVTLDNLFWK
jgi:hypothetical protein